MANPQPTTAKVNILLDAAAYKNKFVTLVTVTNITVTLSTSTSYLYLFFSPSFLEGGLLRGKLWQDVG